MGEAGIMSRGYCIFNHSGKPTGQPCKTQGCPNSTMDSSWYDKYDEYERDLCSKCNGHHDNSRRRLPNLDLQNETTKPRPRPTMTRNVSNHPDLSGSMNCRGSKKMCNKCGKNRVNEREFYTTGDNTSKCVACNGGVRRRLRELEPIHQILNAF